MTGGKNISCTLASYSAEQTSHSDVMNRHKRILGISRRYGNLHFPLQDFLKMGYICTLPYLHNISLIRCNFQKSTNMFAPSNLVSSILAEFSIPLWQGHQKHARETAVLLAVLHHRFHGNLKLQFSAIQPQGQYTIECFCIGVQK